MLGFIICARWVVLKTSVILRLKLGKLSVLNPLINATEVLNSEHLFFIFLLVIFRYTKTN